MAAKKKKKKRSTRKGLVARARGAVAKIAKRGRAAIKRAGSSRGLSGRVHKLETVVHNMGRVVVDHEHRLRSIEGALSVASNKRFGAGGGR